MRGVHTLAAVLFAWRAAEPGAADDLQPIRHNNPGLVVDLGVGLWALPLPMDYDGDGDWDMVVATVNKASPGVYFFENKQGPVPFPVFEPPVRVGDAKANATISYDGGEPVVCTPGQRHPRFRTHALSRPVGIPYKPTFHADRDKQWKLFDLDGDGATDLVVGASDWREYGWDDAFDEQGRWTRGPIHGRVYWMRNAGTDAEPRYEPAVPLAAGDGEVDVFGAPSPCFADWDGDGDKDLVCGSFLDSLTYFENVGGPARPKFATGRPVWMESPSADVEPMRMELQMLQVVALDWDGDGRVDLVVGKEDGRVALALNTGRMVDGVPVFSEPRFFQQRADLVKCGALTTPYSVDWDGDGDEDLVCGNTAGFLEWIENVGGDPPRWGPPRRLHADGREVRIMAGPNGSIQGPAEAKWGYTVPNVVDWNHDGRLDVVVNSIWGSVVWYQRSPQSLADLQGGGPNPVRVAWPGEPPRPEWNWWKPDPGVLVTQWRTSPVVIDLNKDGLNDLVMLDHEGYPAFFERFRDGDELLLKPGRRIFLDEAGEPLRLNPNRAGKSGRRKWTIVDWDGDGRLDLLVDGKNIDFWRNVGAQGEFRFRNEGAVAEKLLAGHDTCPTIVDWDRDGVPDLLIGAEDGFLYYLRNPRGGRPRAGGLKDEAGQGGRE